MKTKKTIILIVEDSLPIAVRIFTLLENLPDVGLVLHSVSSAETLRVIKQTKLDIVLLDINLQDGNGIDILKQLRLLQPESKVIMLTNFTTNAYRDTCFKLGADYFLDKSNDFERIPQIITDLQLVSQN
ncbi:MAG: response regulator [Sphingobacteriales bacterium]|nr:MAG: response regulator [Sphingobacteriales bacterium]